MTTVSSAADRPEGPIDSHTAAVDPPTTFITREDLYTRHGYARSRGFKHVADLLADATFPRPLGERWRLDHIEAWEDYYALLGLRRAADGRQVAARFALASTAARAANHVGNPPFGAGLTHGSAQFRTRTNVFAAMGSQPTPDTVAVTAQRPLAIGAWSVANARPATPAFAATEEPRVRNVTEHRRCTPDAATSNAAPDLWGPEFVTATVGFAPLAAAGERTLTPRDTVTGLPSGPEPTAWIV